MFAIGQSNFLQALGWAVLNSLWQMALLWVVYQLITAVFRKIRASQKSLLATTLLFTGFAWFVFTFFITLADAAVYEGYSAFMSIDRNESVYTWLYTTLPIASVVYLVLLILPLLNFIRNYRYVQLIRHSGLIKADVKWRIFVQNVSAHMGINKPVHVWISELVSSPVTIGFLKPIILLPVAAVNHLSASQVEAVLLHELSHIRRFDFLINLISKAIQTILYFNPFVKAFARIIETEREKNCDEIVLQFQYEPYGYASALLTLEKAAHSSSNLAVAASGDKKKDLLTRIETILGIHKKQIFSFNKLAGIVAALLCFISLNALLLLSKPGETKLKPGLLTDLSVPFHLFTPTMGSEEPIKKATKEPVVIKLAITPVVNKPLAVTTTEELNKDLARDEKQEREQTQANPLGLTAATGLPYIYVNATEKIIPELAPEQEKQVEKAVIASQKVMAEDRWQQVEKSIADAMTSHEKEKLKAEYQKEMSKLDWEKVEDQLKVAYEDVNWSQINQQLDNALAQIKLDSLQQVYTSAFAELSALEKELKAKKQTCIPDSDITLKSLDQQKKETQKAINTIKSVRLRKVVHL